jgi:hypothetical protein
MRDKINRNRKRGRMMASGLRRGRVVAVLTVLATVVFTGAACDKSQAAWDKAVSQNTAAGYQEFVRQYPRSEQVTVAQAKLSELDNNAWKNATSAPDVDAGLREYLHLFPTGKRAKKAQTTLDLRASLPRHFSQEADKVRAAIAVAVAQRLSLDSPAKLLVAQPILIGVDPHAGRSLVLCSVAQGMSVVAGDTLLTARLVFDLRRSDSGVWSAAVGDVTMMDRDRLGEDMSPLLGPMQLQTGQLQVVAVVWGRQ